MKKLQDETGVVLSNWQTGAGLCIMTVLAREIASQIQPGQFVHMKIPGMEGHLLRRPFSVYAVDESSGAIEILYQVVGFGTKHMTSLVPGDEVALIGACGNTWRENKQVKSALLVAGGVGAAPLFMLCENLLAEGASVHVVLGAQTKQALVCYERYKKLAEKFEGANLMVEAATDDGSFGHAGFCTDLVAHALAEKSFDYVAVCGPEPMMRIVAKLALEAGVPCEISLEKRMACGIGACLSCVVETTEGRKRACIDGPVFDAEKVVFS